MKNNQKLRFWQHNTDLLMNNQKGFSAFQLVLILFITGWVALGGWYVWQSKKDNFAHKTDNATNRANTNAASNTQAKTTDANPGYLVIDEWGIKIPISKDTSALSYTFDKNIAMIRSAKLDAVGDKDCDNNSIIITRGLETEIVPQEVSGNKRTYKEVYDSTTIDEDALTPHSIKVKIGDYYFVAPLFTAGSCVNTSAEGAEKARAEQVAEYNAAVSIIKSVNRLIEK